jgi:DNA segregation ATPase FtsK/SpoIIIE, S-DNA-T family
MLLLIFADMAGAKKNKKKKTTESPKFKAEQEEKLSVKEVIKDERTRKITGAFFLLFALFLFIAFTSFLFTWKADQEIARQGFSILWHPSGQKAENLLGNLGAYTSYNFFFNGFGIASYLFCSFFFIVGANLLFSKKIFSIGRNFRYVITGLVFFSVAFAFIFRTANFPWGGAVGNMTSDWLIKTIGWIGTAAILLVVGLAYFIWRFNPVFKVPQIKRKENTKEDIDNETEEDNEGAKLFVDDSFDTNTKGNSLKNGNGKIIDIAHPDFDETGMTELKLIEKEEPVKPNTPPKLEDLKKEEIEDTKPNLIEYTTAEEKTPKTKKQIPNLDLEIKGVVDEKADAEEQKISKPNTSILADYEPTLDLQNYKYPSLELLEAHGSEKIVQDASELEGNKNQIIKTLKNYDIDIQKISATVGPTVTLYEIVPAAGVRISRIKNLEDDIALSLAALGIRIIAPIPGKGTIGIEVPNAKKTIVSMRTLLESEKFRQNSFSLPIAIGKKIDNENFIVDLASMPHLLMAGATGQGKSVGVNAILVSLLYKKHPSQLKLVLVDPKKVELSLYRTIEKHFLAKLPGEEEAIITDTKKVIHTLNALCIEMDNRYDLLKEAGARNIKEYNDKFIKRRLNPQKGHQYLPFIVLVIDEFADLIMTAGKEIEMPIARLAQLARAVGIHLIIATQRPSVNIITGTIKANFPARIAFKVSSKIDSRTILDIGGAEQLIGKGDMLISYNGELTRLQCAFVDTPEVDGITEFIGDQQGYPQAFLLPEYIDEKELEGKEFDLTDRDSLFEDAARLIVQNQIGSTSLLQRRMKLGYNRAGRLMDQLEAAGVVGPGQGSKPRDVLIKTEMDLEQHLQALG